MVPGRTMTSKLLAPTLLVWFPPTLVSIAPHGGKCTSAPPRNSATHHNTTTPDTIVDTNQGGFGGFYSSLTIVGLDRVHRAVAGVAFPVLDLMSDQLRHVLFSSVRSSGPCQEEDLLVRKTRVRQL